MKKIFIILILLLAVNSFALDIIDFELSLEIGLIPRGHLKIYNFTRDVYNDLSFYGDFNFTVDMFNEHLYYGFGAKIYLWKCIEGITFKPDAINFILFAGIRFNENIELFWRHYCNHPIKAWDNGTNTNIESWYEEMGVKITVNTKNN